MSAIRTTCLTFPHPSSALRTERWLYVEYDDGSTALYDRSTDPYELRNIVDAVDPVFIAASAPSYSQLDACSGSSCREADALAVTDPLPQEAG